MFSVQGPYPVIRAALRARGWVERRLPRHSMWGYRHRDQEAWVTEETDSSNDDGNRLCGQTDMTENLQFGMCMLCSGTPDKLFIH